jgi:hypothetical protein
MKKRKIKVDPAVRAGQEFLDAFKKIPYSTDRIGQSFIMRIAQKCDESKQPDTEKASPQDESQSAREKGRELLEGFQKLGYNRDRIGERFIMLPSACASPSDFESESK